MSAQIISGLFDPRRFTSTVISMDSVVFATGGVIGPDNFDLVGQAAASTQAMSDIAAKVNDDSGEPSRILRLGFSSEAENSQRH